jgi:hypothetical protein
MLRCIVLLLVVGSVAAFNAGVHLSRSAFTRTESRKAVRSAAAAAAPATAHKRHARSSWTTMQVWSDSRAVEDYKNLLDGEPCADAAVLSCFLRALVLHASTLSFE